MFVEFIFFTGGNGDLSGGNFEVVDEGLAERFGSDRCFDGAFILGLEQDDGADVFPRRGLLLFGHIFKLVAAGESFLHGGFPLGLAADLDGELNQRLFFKFQGGDVVENIGRQEVFLGVVFGGGGGGR